jgi:hypothetical protein
MSKPARPSPRQEALYAILETSAEMGDATISDSVWDKLVTIAWDNRHHVGDRRDVQRQVRATLLEASREGGGSDAAE